MRVLGVSGSLRRDSHNGRLLAVAGGLLAPDSELVVYDALKAIPPYDEDDELAPHAAVERWREAVADADALLFATPEYNSSVPGQLKNALDWASRPRATAALAGRPAAVIGASTGMFGAIWAQAELRKALASAGARVVDRELPVAYANEAFAPDGSLNDGGHTQALQAMLDELLAEVSRRDRAPVGSLAAAA
jgi:chromate reductase, NAD(P)H dehydrogenase (quinone)